MHTHPEGEVVSDDVPDAGPPNWTDRNPELRRRYLAVQGEIAAAEAEGDARRARRLARDLERISTEFVELNRGLAVAQARRFARGSTDDQDNVSTALMCLWEAFLRYDPDRGVAFSTFSRQYIAGGLQRTVRRNEFQHLSQSEFALRQQIRLAESQLAASLGRHPTDEEVASRTGVPLARVAKIMSPSAASIDEVVGDDGFTLGDRLAAALPDASELDESFDSLLPALSDVEFWTLMQRSGQFGSSGISLVEVADSIGLGREITRRVEARAKVRLAATMLADQLGRLVSAVEVADLLGVPVDRVEPYLASPWRDLRTRWTRLRAAYAVASDDDLVELLRNRLERCGEEVMASAAGTIREASGRYRIGDDPIGTPTAARTLWEAFASWDVRSCTFPTHVRQTFRSRFERFRDSVPQEPWTTEQLWASVTAASPVIAR